MASTRERCGRITVCRGGAGRSTWRARWRIGDQGLERFEKVAVVCACVLMMARWTGWK